MAVTSNKMVSIVIPMYNEEAGIMKFLDDLLLPILEGVTDGVEVILVDDGSRDKTLEMIKKSVLYQKVPVKVIAFSRNFGKEVALSAGLKEAKGDGVIMIDADGQHPVETIPEMIEKWHRGAFVVTAVRKHNSTKHRLGSRLYYRLMKMMGSRNLVVGAMDYRLLDRAVVDEFNKLGEKNRLTRGLIDWLGFPQEYIMVKTKGRLSGKPSYSFKKLTVLTLDSLASSSRVPLAIFGYIGALIMILSGILGLFILIQQYIMGDPLNLDWSGAVAMSVLVTFLVGLVLVSQAMTAIYIAQIHTEAKGRPLYVLDTRRSFKNKAEEQIGGSDEEVIVDKKGKK